MAEEKFEESMKRLEEIVKNLESGELSLEDSLKIFEEGMTLVSSCSKKLDEAEQKVTLLVKEGEGKYSRHPFDTEDEEET